MSKPAVIAAFDFDETLITKDSLLDFARYSFSLPVFLIKAAQFAPTLLAFKRKHIPNHVAKERFLKHFFGGMTVEAFDKLGEAYARRLDAIINSEALDKLNWHKKQGHTVIIISASISNWIKPWAAQHSVDRVISSEIQLKNGKLTGLLKGKNCHGPEKPKRFLEVFPNRSTYKLVVYGDGKSDQEMFKLADTFYEKSFK